MLPSATIIFLNQFFWCVIVSVGIQFLILSRIAKEFRYYSYFGISLILSAVVLWPPAMIFPPVIYDLSLKSLFITRFTWAIASFAGFFLIVFHRKLSNARKLKIEKITLIIAGGFSFLQIMEMSTKNGLMFGIENGIIQGTKLFGALWGIYATLMCGLIITYLFIGLKTSPEARKSGFRYLILAGVAIWAAIICDAFTGTVSFLPAEMVFSVYGLTVYALAAGYNLFNDWMRLYATNQEKLVLLNQSFLRLQNILHFRTIGLATAGISHDLRNYSSVLRSNAKLLDRSQEESQMGESFLNMAENLSLLSERLGLSNSGSREGQNDALDLESLANRCAQRLAHVETRFVVEQCPKHLRVRGDNLELERVFHNLFQNSVEAGAQNIRVRFREESGNLKVQIQDDGHGRATLKNGSVFKAFSSSKRDQGGTGLGGVTIDEVLKNHGATFRIKSCEAGEAGICVDMVFPLEESAWPR